MVEGPISRNDNNDRSNSDLSSPDSLHQRQSLLRDEHTGYGTVRDNATSSEEPTTELDGGETQIDPKVRRKVMLAMPALAIGIFLASADQTIVVSSYAKIGSEMQALNQISWIATTYLITQTCFQPLYGKLSEIFGRKSTLLFAFAVFGIGNLLCGLSRTIKELLAARAIAGIGGGGMTTLVAILLSDVIPLPERGTWQGYNNIIYAAGLGVGAPIGGYFADHAGWRWSFIIQVPLTVIGFFNVHFVMDLPAMESSNWMQKLRKVDFGGALMLIFAVCALLVGLHEGANITWQSPVAIACLCASVPLFASFVLLEVKYVAEPFAPRHVLFNRTLLACSLCNLFAAGTWLAIGYYLPLYWQAVEHLSATQAAIRLLPGIIANVLGSLFAGVVMQHKGKYYWLTVICYTTLMFGVIPIILCTGLISRSIWGIWIGTVICGFSNGIGNTSSLVALIAYADRKDQAVAIATLYLFRSLGSVVGISVSAAVIQQILRNRVKEALEVYLDVDVDDIVHHIRESLEYIDTLKPGFQSIIRLCYEHATRWSFIVDMGIAVGAVVASGFIRERPLFR